VPAANLLSLSVGVPLFAVGQAEAKAAARELFARKALFDRLSGVFDNAGIEQRNIVAPIHWYGENHGWAERNRVYLESADGLFLDVARRAIDQAGLEPDAIDGIVTVSTTGIATPSLDARNALALGLRADVRRVPMFGLGCAGGVSGLATAARLAAAEPGSRWLFVTVETCSISIRLDSDDPAAIVATALFGDGAAAAVVEAGGKPGIGAIEAAGEHLWPATLGIMGWRVEDPGLAVIFDRSIPVFLEANLAPAVQSVLAQMGVTYASIDRLCSHPGGVKVLDAIESALELDDPLDLERDVLRDNGNISAPTVFFVLDRLIARGLPHRTLLTALGPGFTLSALSLLAA